MELIQKYFPALEPLQSTQFEKLLEVIPLLNQQVNVISRKDVDHLEERHILHSLAIAKQFSFGKRQTIVDAGTGGGFPGIPLAILFPEARFILVDSIGKKIRLVDEVCTALNLKNVKTIHERVEKIDIRADFVVARAVTALPKLYSLTRKVIRSTPGKQPGGLIALKGGDLESELGSFKARIKIYPISEWFPEPFFSTKKIVYLKF
ncbi:MAG: 16S rRNA (guanine(527)-N(7))-methyltransferase RsmG [Bacteroidota bacterium]